MAIIGSSFSPRSDFVTFVVKFNYHVIGVIDHIDIAIGTSGDTRIKIRTQLPIAEIEAMIIKFYN